MLGVGRRLSIELDIKYNRLYYTWYYENEKFNVASMQFLCTQRGGNAQKVLDYLN